MWIYIEISRERARDRLRLHDPTVKELIYLDVFRFSFTYASMCICVHTHREHTHTYSGNGPATD